ncbi:response regulator [Paenibacillus sp. HWE-109]|uniref:response regulator n=1 Tax=Paenibacillus sp. HWE-109 TaxID=1306526 RepID=UPI001EE0C6DB|nr:response regulator [Paenibacillus sp. HWE-109]UKS29438.1 response regulator [Paenibacillus sp. HWE-109]
MRANTKGSYRILIAEDEPLIMRNIAAKIENATDQFEILYAENGKEALDVIEALRPQVLFTDIQMPQMNGIELIEQVSSKYPRIQIVVISGHDEFDYAQQALRYGARDFLLKPLDADDIKKTLSRICAQLDQEKAFSEKEQVHSALQTGEILPQHAALQGSVFKLFLIQIGHLANTSYSSGLAGFFDHLWMKVNRSKAIPTLLGDAEDWWLVDQLPFHGKYLVIKTEEAVMQQPLVCADALLAAVREQVEPYPVTIVHAAEPAKLEKLWSTSQGLRVAMERGLAPGRSAIFSNTGKVRDLPSAWIDPNTQHKLVSFIQGNKRVNFNKELCSLFEHWTVEAYPQKWIEKKLQHLIQIVHQQAIHFSDEEIFHLEYDMLNTLYTAANFPSISERILTLLENTAFLNEEHLSEGAEELTHSIESYLKTNFAHPITLEDIAAKFNFDSSYLTKIFKKYKHMTPIKYLISLRMDEAKRLIQQHPELSFKEIGAIVGYPDSHYFSRIFKNMTGQNLSDYSEGMKLQGE